MDAVFGALFVAAALTATAARADDRVASLQLQAAAFAGNEVRPDPGRATAMAFLPGRGVVQWDVTGKTPEQAKEAQIEAMGLADAQAVQREIDAADAAKQAQAEEAARRQAARAGAARKLALDTPALAGFSHEAVAVIPLGRSARKGNALGVKNGEEMKGKPRVYAFAAASGQAVGLNVMHDEDGWKNAGVSTDRGGFVGQRQAGLALRVGKAQASLSYIQQKERGQLMGMTSDKDHRVMLTMNVTPQTVLGLFQQKR